MDALKKKARTLHRAAQGGDADALERLRAVPELEGLGDDELALRLQLRHALSALARELGFRGWSHLTAVVQGEEDDFGTLLSPPGAAAYWNIWSADHAEARAIREEHGGYLLAYRRQYFVVERGYIDFLGLDPDDPDWERIGCDWARPGDVDARARLYEQLFEQHGARPRVRRSARATWV